ncbi:hypothetical protein CLOP_g12950, partial [Closterium sp. NIES-67]
LLLLVCRWAATLLGLPLLLVVSRRSLGLADDCRGDGSEPRLVVVVSDNGVVAGSGAEWWKVVVVVSSGVGG